VHELQYEASEKKKTRAGFSPAFDLQVHALWTFSLLRVFVAKQIDVTTSGHFGDWEWGGGGQIRDEQGLKRVIGIPLHSSRAGLNTGLIAVYGKKSKA